VKLEFFNRPPAEQALFIRETAARRGLENRINQKA